MVREARVGDGPPQHGVPGQAGGDGLAGDPHQVRRGRGVRLPGQSLLSSRCYITSTWRLNLLVIQSIQARMTAQGTSFVYCICLFLINILYWLTHQNAINAFWDL